jgi:hypothetical protein
MEYLHADPLSEILRRAATAGTRLAPALAAYVAASVAEGLHAGHELRGRDGTPLGLVHRRLAPRKIFVTGDGRTKILGFGIGHIEDDSSASRCGVLRGVIAYLTPEQIRGEPEDRRTDVFALGHVLWEMLTGRRLFRGESDLDTLWQVLEGQVPDPASIAPDCPPALSACVLRALARRPEDRFPTALDFARALQPFVASSATEDLARLVHSLCADSIRARQLRLDWAAGVSAPGGGDDVVLFHRAPAVSAATLGEGASAAGGASPYRVAPAERPAPPAPAKRPRRRVLLAASLAFALLLIAAMAAAHRYAGAGWNSPSQGAGSRVAALWRSSK